LLTPVINSAENPEEEVIINVLYVDDEENNLEAFKASFRRYFNIFTATSVDAGKEVLKEHEIQILITDQRMPGALGTDLLAQAVQDYPDQIRIRIWKQLRMPSTGVRSISTFKNHGMTTSSKK
jgi:response regulator RpfG family c-di-GMP phosphodiesterase